MPEEYKRKVGFKSNKDSQITSVKAPYTVLFLLCITLIVLIFFVWAFKGRVSETVEGTGITVSEEGTVMPIISMGDGVLANLNIKIGSKIRVGQVLGQLYNPTLPNKIDLLDKEYLSIKEMQQNIETLKNVDGTLSETVQNEIKALSQKLLQKKEKFEFDRKEFGEKYWIHSSYEGEVVELLKNVGEYVKIGDKIAIVSPTKNYRLYIVAYIPFEYAQRVKNGMKAYFSPSSVSSNKYGFIKCIVRSTNNLPISPEAIESELMNKSLQNMIIGTNSVVRVELEMVPDKDSKNGYGWTSRQGFNQAISRGIVGTVVIDTSYKSPLSLVISVIDSLF